MGCWLSSCWLSSCQDLATTMKLLALVVLGVVAINAAPLTKSNTIRHTVHLRIINHSHLPLAFKEAWFDHGRLKSCCHWPKVIKGYNSMEVYMHESDHSFAGCSGYVTYIMGQHTATSTPVTIAFSNPAAGKNKLDVGTGDAKYIWKHMTSNNYKTFKRPLFIEGVHMIASGEASPGYTNEALVQFIA